MAENNSYTNATSHDGVPEVELRDPRLAAFLAWLVPGLGHLYQRRTGKGLLFMITILGTFAYGMYLGDGRVVYASTTNPVRNFQQFTQRWQYACQLPIGVAALPAVVQTWRVETGREPLHLFGDNFERPPYTPGQVVYFFGDREKRQLTPELKAKYFETEDFAGNIVEHATEQQKWNHDLNYDFELGTVFTMIAGLLNVLAICDARWGPLVTLPAPDDKTDGKKADAKSANEAA